MDGVTPDIRSAPIDLEVIRAKYRRERDKRIRQDGRDQYIQVTGDFSRYLDNPYEADALIREPLVDEIDVAIIGGGFGGMLSGARLREAGIDNFRIIEVGGDFGGTWYWNRYPGCQCDIDSYCYLPLLEEVGYIPKEKYSYAPEIFEHSRRIADYYKLYDNAALCTRVTGLLWDQSAARWIIATDRGDAMRARFVITATGLSNRPKLPGIPGLEAFKGHAFHTCRWDYDYTGGDHQGGLTGLNDKRVAIIGTGATAIQAVPFLGRYAEHLYVFQRTPSSVDERGNKPTDIEWAKALQPGWQKRRRENFNSIAVGQPVDEDLVDDKWTENYRALASWANEGTEFTDQKAEQAEILDAIRMNQLRDRIDQIVASPTTASALKPWYRLFCKRPTFNDHYLQTFNRPNVTLVDTSETRGVERITENGVVAGGIEYPADCIILATGFETIGTDWVRRQDYDVVGQGGVRLSDYFAGGLRTLHGFTSHGFPNYFLQGFSQNGASVNITAVLDSQALHIVYIIKQLIERGVGYAQPTIEAESAWVTEIGRLSGSASQFLAECTPGYFNGEGQKSSGKQHGLESYAPGINAFNTLMEAWRDQGDMEGFEFGPPLDELSSADRAPEMSHG